LQLAQVAVLARLLAPQDYGLMAMVGVVLGFAGLFADMGINSAFVQRQNVSEDERSSLFWLNVGLSAALSMLVVVLSPVLAGWFGDTRLTPLLMLAASTFVIAALGQQVRMNAEKALNFRPVVLLEVAAALLGFGTAVGAALAGWGVYALIAGGLVSTIGGTVLAWLFLADGWRPLWRFRLADVRSYMGFGGALVANNLVNEVNRNIDLMLGGRLLGATALGLFSMPRNIVFQIQGMVNPIITRVGFPLIAQVQADISRVRAIYLKTLNMTASTNAPIYIGIAFFAPEVVRVVLGPKWLVAADLLRLLTVWGLLRSTGNPVGSLLLGMGRADLSLKWNLGLLFVVPPALWGGSQYGTVGLAWALLGVAAALFIPGWYVLVRPLCKAGLIEYTVAALRPMVLATVAIAPAYFLAQSFSDPATRLLLGAVVAAPLYFWLSYLMNREWVTAMMHLAGRGRLASA
jgi:O-antigen/teichoic acid export membrane protein